MEDKLVFDYSKLKGRIREKFGNNYNFAKELGCNNSTLSLKLNNQSEFSQKEIFTAIRILNLNESDIPDYFFAVIV